MYNKYIYNINIIILLGTKMIILLFSRKLKTKGLEGEGERKITKKIFFWPWSGVGGGVHPKFCLPLRKVIINFNLYILVDLKHIRIKKIVSPLGRYGLRHLSAASALPKKNNLLYVIIKSVWVNSVKQRKLKKLLFFFFWLCV